MPYPSLYQVNTRVWLTELARGLGRPATLDDIPDDALDQIARRGFDWVWLLSVWQTGHASRRVSQLNPEWLREFRQTLPDLCDQDIPGSGFAITAYSAHQALGGDVALAHLRTRLAHRGLRLMLDFVPNHTALDHPWLADYPHYYVRGSQEDLAREPGNYAQLRTNHGDLVLAHGRDPYFPGWSDTLQLDYGNPAVQAAMTAELVKVAERCDGVRCDMAMLLLPEVFARTWGIPARPFWPAAIARVRAQFPHCLFLAEAYWDLESAMIDQGFDYAYDKRLYDRLREGRAGAVRELLQAPLEIQGKLARFLENHDEPRAAAVFPDGQRQAAAVITYLAPGLRFFHQGQLEGRRQRISAHLCRAPAEAVNGRIEAFYERLLEILRRDVVRQGDWRLLPCAPAWDGNESSDAFVAFLWQASLELRLLVAVNYAAHQSQCFVRLPLPDLHSRAWRLRDLLGEFTYERDGDDLLQRGLYLDVPAWHSHVFEMTPR